MHALFTTRLGFPLHRNLRPIFISFHCNKRDLLTPEAIEYLKRYGPVGCRDWTTVDLLLSCGVPAFFSGCLTTTIDTVFPDAGRRPRPADAPPAYVDMPADDVPRGRDGLQAHRSRGAPPPVRRERRRRARPARDLPDAAPRASSPPGCTATCRCARSARRSSSGRGTAPTSASTGCSTSTTRRSTRSATACSSGSSRSSPRSSPARPRRRSTRCGATSRPTTCSPPRRAACGRPRCRPPTRRTPRPRPRGRRDGRTPAPPAGTPCTVAVVLPRGAGLELAVLVASLLEHASRPLHVWVLARPGERAASGWPRASPTWRRAGCRCAGSAPGAAAAAPRAAARRRPRGAAAAALDGDRRRRRARGARPRRPRVRGARAARDGGISGFGVIHAAGTGSGTGREVARRAAPDRPRPAPVRLRRVHRRRARARSRPAARAAPLRSPLADAFGLDDRRGAALARRRRTGRRCRSAGRPCRRARRSAARG